MHELVQGSNEGCRFVQPTGLRCAAIVECDHRLLKITLVRCVVIMECDHCLT